MFFLLMMFCWLLAACSSVSGSSGGTVDWYAMRIFSDQSGWAITSRGVIHTADNGQHWAIVTPPELAGSNSFSGATSYFLDSQHAWLARTGETQYIRYGDKQLYMPIQRPPKSK